jgi:hypothetical protein
MSQFNAPVRRSGGNLDVYTGLAFVAALVLTAAVALMALKNLEHSAAGGGEGGVIKLID